MRNGFRFGSTRCARDGAAGTSLHRRVVAAVLVLVALLCSQESRAQETTEGTLKGAFVFHFATFTEWPPDVLMEGMPITACVIGDRAVASALVANAAGRDIDGHGVQVTTPTLDSLDGCHVLYVSSLSPAVVEEAIMATAGAPVLTISDVDEFARDGGVAELFVEAGKMRFRINLNSAMSARLELSSRLLSLAELIDASDD